MIQRNASSILVVTADDFGIGPETSRAILDLACRGRITATVLLVNSPFAKQAVRDWKAAAPNVDLGWHANLTLDRPILASREVRSLVDAKGNFWPLRSFLWRWAAGRIATDEVEREWTAQWQRFCDLTGHPPDLVNSHQHVAIFNGPSQALLNVLEHFGERPFVRRVCEPVPSIWNHGNARLKRCALALLGARQAATLRARYPGCDFLAGVANHQVQIDAAFSRRRVAATAGGSVDLMVHPGFRDETLIGRDCRVGDGCLERRVAEWTALASDAWRDFLNEQASRIVRPSSLASLKREVAHAA